MRIVIILSLISLMLGCASQPEPMQLKDRITGGMDESDVKELLGVPTLWKSHENEKEEVWQYCVTERFKPVNDVIVIWFYERRVTGVSTYKSAGFGACEMFFRNLKWEEAPHRKKMK